MSAPRADQLDPAVLAALGHPVRLALVRRLLTGPAGSSVIECKAGAEQGNTFSHNDVYNGTASPYAGCANQTAINGNISADPLLTPDYRPLAGSPARSKVTTCRRLPAWVTECVPAGYSPAA